MTDRTEGYNNIDYLIRRTVVDDLDAVVQVHLKSFTGFFLTFLGPDFLFLLYKNILTDPDGVFYVAEREHRVEGFIAGVQRQADFYKRLIKNEKWLFAKAALTAFIRKPTIAPRLIRALSKPDTVDDGSAHACLMSIAVLPQSENMSIGRNLIDTFCKELINRHVYSVCLTTDRFNNEKVNRFYEKSGFKVIRSFMTNEGRAMNAYVKNLILQDVE